MALPLPDALQPGGDYLAAQKVSNAVTQQALANRMQEIKNFYAPKDITSQIDERNALTKKYNTMTPLEAAELAIKNKYGEQRELANIKAAEALADYRKSGGFGGGAGVRELNAISRQIQSENPNFTPDQVIDARNAYFEGRDTLKDGTPVPEMSGTTRTLINQSYKRGTDVSQRNQERYAQTLETTFEEGDKVAPGAFQFASAAGKIKGGIEALKAQRGESDPEYQDYLIFTRQIVPAMASEILRTGGANSTDTQKTLAIQQANPITYDSNPELAMNQYIFLKSLYKKIGKTVAQGPAQTHAKLIGNKSIDMSNLSDDELRKIAYGK